MPWEPMAAAEGAPVKRWAAPNAAPAADTWGGTTESVRGRPKRGSMVVVVEGLCCVAGAPQQSAVGGGGRRSLQLVVSLCGVASLNTLRSFRFSVCPRAPTHARTHNTHTPHHAVPHRDRPGGARRDGRRRARARVAARGRRRGVALPAVCVARARQRGLDARAGGAAGDQGSWGREGRKGRQKHAAPQGREGDGGRTRPPCVCARGVLPPLPCQRDRHTRTPQKGVVLGEEARLRGGRERVTRPAAAIRAVPCKLCPPSPHTHTRPRSLPTHHTGHHPAQRPARRVRGAPPRRDGDGGRVDRRGVSV